jgi:hypothetical protein
MNTYRMDVLTAAPASWTDDDLLATVVSTVSALTFVDSSSVKGAPARGVRSVRVVFSGLNDEEARETARQARASVPGGADTLLALRTGGGYRPVATS